LNERRKTMLLSSIVFRRSSKGSNAPQGGLAEHVGAGKGALAQITQKLGTASDLSAAFARRHQELTSAIAAGRDWLGIAHDSLPDRMAFMRCHIPLALAAASRPHAIPQHQGTQTDLARPCRTGARRTEGCRHVRQPGRHRQGAACGPQGAP
jgi:hypothetical protein